MTVFTGQYFSHISKTFHSARPEIQLWQKTWKKTQPKKPTTCPRSYLVLLSPLKKPNKPTKNPHLPEIADRRKSQKYSLVDFFSFLSPRTRMLFVQQTLQVGSRKRSSHRLKPAQGTVKMHSFHKTGWATLPLDYIGSALGAVRL